MECGLSINQGVNGVFTECQPSCLSWVLIKGIDGHLTANLHSHDPTIEDLYYK